jgi:hypothetical protein
MPFTTLNTALFAPMPSASVRLASAVKRGDCCSRLIAWATS